MVMIVNVDQCRVCHNFHRVPGPADVYLSLSYALLD